MTTSETPAPPPADPEAPPTSSPPCPACGKVPLIYRRVSDVLATIKAVGKNKRNQQQNYDFRSIDDFYDAAQPALAAARVFITPTILEARREEGRTSKGNLVQVTFIRVRFRLWTEDGSFIEADAVGEGSDSGDKSPYKAQAGAMKYLLMQVFSVRVGASSLDPENDSHEYDDRRGSPSQWKGRAAPPPNKPAAGKPASKPAAPREGTDLKALEADLRKSLVACGDLKAIQQWAKDWNAAPAVVKEALRVEAREHKRALQQQLEDAAARAEADAAARAAEGPAKPAEPFSCEACGEPAGRGHRPGCPNAPDESAAPAPAPAAPAPPAAKPEPAAARGRASKGGRR